MCHFPSSRGTLPGFGAVRNTTYPTEEKERLPRLKFSNGWFCSRIHLIIDHGDCDYMSNFTWKNLNYDCLYKMTKTSINILYMNVHTLNISSFKNKDASNHLFKSFTWSPRLPLSIGDSHLHPFWVFLPQSVTLRHPIEPQGQEERSLDCSMVGCVATS